MNRLHHIEEKGKNGYLLNLRLVSSLLRWAGIPDKTGSVSTSMQLGYMPNAEMGDWDSMVGGMVDVSAM